MRIFCVVPAYNEAKNIVKVIKEIRPLVGEVVVVDDGSSDKTRELAKAQAVTVLSHIINRGQGAALKTGTEYALRQGAELVIHYDADGQFLASDIKTVIEPIVKGRAEVVFGSRFLSKRSRLPLLKEKLIMPLARLANRFFLAVNYSDPQSGFRAFSAAAANKITWRQDGMAHCSEILFEVKRSGLKVEEVPITVIYHNFGQRLGGGFKILKDLLVAKFIN